MKSLLAGLRHTAAFALLLTIGLMLVSMPPPPSPEDYSAIFHFRMAVGFVAGWASHGLYRMILRTWDEYKLERARKILAVGSIIALGLIVCGPFVANAQERPGWRQYCSNWGHCRWVRIYRPPVYGYEHREYELSRNVDRRHCKDVRRVVGNQHLTVDGAKKAADEAWAGDVRFRYGELFMALNNARDISYTCSRSSIKEGGVTTLGQTLSRCELQAIPCAALRTEPATRMDEDER